MNFPDHQIERLANWLRMLAASHHRDEQIIQNTLRLCASAFEKLVQERVSETIKDVASYSLIRNAALEEAANEIDCGCAHRPLVLAKTAAENERNGARLCPHYDTCCALQAKAIRDLKT